MEPSVNHNLISKVLTLMVAGEQCISPYADFSARNIRVRIVPHLRNRLELSFNGWIWHSYSPNLRPYIGYRSKAASAAFSQTCSRNSSVRKKYTYPKQDAENATSYRILETRLSNWWPWKTLQHVSAAVQLRITRCGLVRLVQVWSVYDRVRRSVSRGFSRFGMDWNCFTKNADFVEYQLV